MACSTDILHQYRQVASYVDRILHGANPADLPVQAPTRYETAIDLRTAKGLTRNNRFNEVSCLV